MRTTDLVNSAAKFIQIHTNQSYQESKIEAEEIFMHVLGINKSKIYTNISISMTKDELDQISHCLLYTSPSPRDVVPSRMPSSA